ncbi:MAG TPA: hypothetical protein VGQ08_13295 [Nitrospiraceae bacterium]|nr:hypothetical protein [Nitrospiraceae bacterium]
MAGGQAITSGQGTLVYTEGDALTGSEATSAPGTPGLNRLLPLRSRKAGRVARRTRRSPVSWRVVSPARWSMAGKRLRSSACR